ncbi:hypothetical protein BVX98_01675 [bacterium F11]|nr:hypothetical protein BVX98_01675 [bacterium F11]
MNLNRIPFIVYIGSILMMGSVQQMQAAIPSSISNLTAITGTTSGEIDLSWTAPGGDGTTGTADGYLVRFSSTGQINNDVDFSTATVFVQSWTPLSSGSMESRVITGLVGGTTYYCAIQAYHAANGTATWNQSGGVNNANFARAQLLSSLSWSTHTVALSSTSLKWAWDDIPEESGYRVFNATSDTNLTGDLAQNTTVYIQTGLTPNTTYQAYLQAFEGITTLNSATTLQVSLTDMPTGLTSPTQDVTTLNLSWNENGNPSNTVFNLERSPNGVDTWTISVTTNSTYEDRFLNANTTYYYRVQALNHALVGSGYETILTTITLANIPNTFTSPTQSSTTINLSWNAGGNPAGTLFDLERSTDGISNWSVIHAKITNTSASDSGLDVNTTYYYRVRAFNYSLVATSYTSTLDVVTLATTPVNLFSPFQTNTVLTLQWQANGNPTGTTYDLERSTDGATGWTTVLNLSTNTDYVDSPVNERTTYYYRVRAQNHAQVYSSYTVVVPTNTSWIRPSSISSLHALQGSLDGEVELRWVAPGNDGPTGTVITYSVKHATFNVTSANFDDGNVGSFIPSWTSLMGHGIPEIRTVTGLTPAVTYFFAMKGVDTGGSALWDDSANPNRSAYATDLAPPVPTGFIATPGDHQMTLSWDSISSLPDLEGYWVERATSSDFTTVVILATVPAIQTSTTDVSLANQTMYFYRIRSIDTPPLSLYSSYSSPISSSTLDTDSPDSVSVISATTGNLEGELALTWTWTGDDGNTADVVNGFYRIKVSTESSESWNSSEYTVAASTDATQGSNHTRVITGLIPSATYYCRIWITDEAGNVSGLSAGATNWAQVDITPPETISPISPTEDWHQVHLTWTSPGDDGAANTLTGTYEIAYTILGIIDNTSKFQSAEGQISFSTTMAPGFAVGYTVTGLTTGFRYYFAIRTLDERGNTSGISASTSAVTPNSAPQSFTLVSPSDNSISTSNPPLFDWSESIDANSNLGDQVTYTVQYSISNGFEANFTTTTSGLTTSQHNPLDLPEDFTVYWRVVAYDVDGSSVAGSPDPLRIRTNVVNTSPYAFNLLSPSNQSIETSGNLTFDWQDAVDGDPGDTVSYNLELSTNASFSPLSHSSSTANSTFSLVRLLEDTTYYWRVRATDGLLDRLSTIYWFAVNAVDEAPNSFSLLTPAEDERLLTLTPTLTWEDTTANDPGDTIQFKLTYSHLSNYASSTTVFLSTTTYTLPAQSDNVNIYWFVEAIDGGGKSQLSQQTHHCYIDLTKETPAAFQLQLPLSTITVRDLRPLFTWENAVDPDPFDTVRYFIELSPNDPTFNGVQSLSIGTGNSYQPATNLSNEATYYWRVSAGGFQGATPTLVDSTVTVSEVSFFFLDTANIPPLSFDLLTPSHQAILNLRQPTFTWETAVEIDLNDVATYLAEISTHNDLSNPVVSQGSITDTEWKTSSFLNENTTYYWRVTATDVDSLTTQSDNIFQFFIPILNRLQPPGGIKGSFSVDLSSWTLEWTLPIENRDGTTATDLTGFHIYRSLDSELIGTSNPVATVSSNTTSWIDGSVNGTSYFYMVRSFDDSNIESYNSAIVEAKEDPIHVVYSEDLGLRIMMSSAAASKLLYPTDGKVKRISISEGGPPSGKTLISYSISIENDSDRTPIGDFQFDHPISLSFSVDTLSNRASSLQALATPFVAGETAIYWHNGVENVKLGGTVDATNNWLSLNTIRTGNFQVKQVIRAASAEILQIWPKKIFTPNGDGVNDTINFSLDNPKDSSLSGKIFNLHGAHVANLTTGSDGSSLYWDGRRKGGNMAPKGIYLYQIEVDGNQMSGTIVVAR